jgi:pSer/pThr/pTyr-binding forkhead associated (FHA) protein
MKLELINIAAAPLSRKNRIVIPRLPAVIGRSPKADVRLNIASVSRFHCRIEESRGRLVVRDLNSLNGTQVNGDAVESAELKPSDHVTIGDMTFEVAWRPNLAELPSTVIVPPHAA